MEMGRVPYATLGEPYATLGHGAPEKAIVLSDVAQLYCIALAWFVMLCYVRKHDQKGRHHHFRYTLLRGGLRAQLYLE